MTTKRKSKETDLEGYVRMGCPQCAHEVLYREDSDFVPLCPKCELRMEEFPIEETTAPQERAGK